MVIKVLLKSHDKANSFFFVQRLVGSSLLLMVTCISYSIVFYCTLSEANSVNKNKTILQSEPATGSSVPETARVSFERALKISCKFWHSFGTIANLLAKPFKNLYCYIHFSQSENSFLM